MPDMDGFEVLRQLREFSWVPVIAFSATPEFSARAFECGANAFIAKPFNTDQIMNMIKKLTYHQE
jgi:CheY-like chemotaxis protein